MSLSSRRHQRGQMSIEMVLVVAAILVFFAGIVFYFTIGRYMIMTYKESAALSTMVGKAQKLFQDDPNGFANATNTALIDNSVVPSNNANGTTISSAFGTPVTIEPTTLYTADDGLQWTYLVPPQSCSDFIQDEAGTFARITAGGSTLKDTTTGVTTVNEQTMGTACSGTGGGNVTILFTNTR